LKIIKQDFLVTKKNYVETKKTIFMSQSTKILLKKDQRHIEKNIKKHMSIRTKIL